MGEEKETGSGSGSDRCRSIREEFQLNKFGLGHEHPTLFARPQVCKSIFIYVL